ncbi:ABC transporter permease [Limnovirga soli]|uniref:FtsX-like permease family protein n=1 Tax=Limnovirga soli TaxID=2656915 RepID=A0A8J8JQX1_9BACT|nr:ABC transporter permease [Limnovirga soli]NNV55217.1 FtsX-like permease family protein [Limnovirga soli]
MLKTLSIFWNSFKLSVQELNNNKLRSSLSLIGIAFGIFCIIGVLATVGSLESKVQSDINALGSNTIYIDKWEYGGGDDGDYPWWKYINRPLPKYDEVSFIKQKSTLAKHVCYFNSTNANATYKNNQYNNVGIYCVSEDFAEMQTIEISNGRYLNATEFIRGNAVGVIGNEIAIQLFGSPEKAIDKTVTFDGKKVVVTGVIKKQGQSFVGGFDYDHCILLSYRYYASIYDVNGKYTDAKILVNAQDNVPTAALIDDLKGIMRAQRRLSPTDEDNFALNDINNFSKQVSGFFGQVNVGGWAIAGLSLIVGLFGVANIMFVTVRERTSQIGLKKAIGAKKRTILTEFLLESAFLCIIGGLMGVLMVWLLALGLSSVLPFPIVVSPNIITLAFTLCVVLGVLSGIIPASIAAKMDPVVAIRSK